MEAWQAAINFAVGIIVTGVTELVKKISWLPTDMPIVKYILVLILSAGAGVGMGWIYGLDITPGELARQAVVIALGAVGFKSMFKSGG